MADNVNKWLYGVMLSLAAGFFVPGCEKLPTAYKPSNGNQSPIAIKTDKPPLQDGTCLQLKRNMNTVLADAKKWDMLAKSTMDMEERLGKVVDTIKDENSIEAIYIANLQMAVLALSKEVNNANEALNLLADNPENHKAEKIAVAGQMKGHVKILADSLNKLNKLELNKCLNEAEKNGEPGQTTPSEPQSDINALSTRVNALETETAKLAQRFWNMPDAILSILVAFISTWLAMAVLFAKLRQARKEAKDSLKNKESMEQDIIHLKNKLSSYEDSLKAINGSLASIQQSMAVTVGKRPTTGKKTLTPPTQPAEFALTQRNPPPHQAYAYSPAPDHENNFDARQFSEQMTRDVLYKLCFIGGGHSAEFEFINQADIVKSALRYPRDLLFSACENDNDYDLDAKQLITVAKGEAIRQGDKWHITQKAKIRYDV